MLETAGLKCKVDGCNLVPAPHGAGVPDGSLFGSHCGAVHTPDGEKWFPPVVGAAASNDAMVRQLNARLAALETREIEPRHVIDVPGESTKSGGPAEVR